MSFDIYGNGSIRDYEKLIPELFIVSKSTMRSNLTYKTNTHFHTRSFSIYRGVLIVHRKHTRFQKESFAAYIYDRKTRKKKCIAVEFTHFNIQMDVDDFLSTYKSQLVHNKEGEVKGIVTGRIPCNSIACPAFTTCTKVAMCQGLFRVRHFRMPKKYFYICSDNLFVRGNDKELQVSPKVPSVFVTTERRHYFDEKNKQVKDLTNEDGSDILLA